MMMDCGPGDEDVTDVVVVIKGGRRRCGQVCVASAWSENVQRPKHVQCRQLLYY